MLFSCCDQSRTVKHFAGLMHFASRVHQVCAPAAVRGAHTCAWQQLAELARMAVAAVACGFVFLWATFGKMATRKPTVVLSMLADGSYRVLMHLSSAARLLTR